MSARSWSRQTGTSLTRRNLRGGLGCFLLVVVVIAVVIALGVWAWQQPGGNAPIYWD
ncbi:hypothetical protein ABZ608_26695 [Streptomyces sp. NPDC013172]|uniref:hypothetical protein n=1 Tax=Streptomyces sp. NPDC013172 TaxID=3155009 RepID=UPI0033E849FB